MKDNKENTSAKLDKIKTDLEIRLVKLELQKLKVKEDDLLKKTEAEKKSIANKKENLKKELLIKEEIINKKNSGDLNTKVIPIKKENIAKKTTKNGTTSNKKNSLIKPITTTKKTTLKPELKKEVLVKKPNKNDTLHSEKEVIKKVVSAIEKKKVTKKNIEKKSSLTKYLILGIVIIAVLLFALKNVYNLKEELNNKEQLLINQVKEQDQIDLGSGGYFKEVEDEVSEEDLQDFNNYKDIPELVVKNNKKSIITKPKDLKSINRQIQRAAKNKQAVAISKNKTLVKQNNNLQNDKSNIVSSTNEQVSNKVTITKEEKDTEGEKEENKVTSDYMKIVGLQLVKDGKFIIPKKAKKTNSFSVRIRLNKFKRKTTSSKVEVMLVIKDARGKTIKIDVKKVNFGTNKTIYLTFYETIKDKLEINKNYTFSVFADKVLIKNIIKII